MNPITRRAFLFSSLKGAAGLAFLPLAGCRSRAPFTGGAPGVPAYPLVEAEGTHREIGKTIGAAMKGPIRKYFSLSRDFPRCRAFLGPGREKIEKMLGRVQARFPDLVEELDGMAEALDIPFMDLFAYNCRSEISLLSRRAKRPDAPGCSTIALKRKGRLILAHNEDGDDANKGRMFLVKATPPSGVSFIAFVYPGLLPGNGPGFNSLGLLQTTNYIQPREVADGVPRYFIGRAVLEARSLDEAAALATTGERAFSWHHNLASLPEGRLLSVETYPGRHHVLDVKGLYIHTNHLIHPEMAAPGGGTLDVRYESSLTRYRVLIEAIERNGPPATARGMAALLSLHDGRPYSPCRHPEGDIHGATLGTALFEGKRPAMTLFHGNPCSALEKRYAF